MATEISEQALLLLRYCLDNSTADFRAGQWEAIEELVQKRSRLLVVQRTGWGSSLIRTLLSGVQLTEFISFPANLFETF